MVAKMSSKKNIIKPTIAQVAEIVADHSTPASTGLVDTYGNSILKSEEPTGVTYSTFKDLGANPQEGDLISLVTQDTVLELPNPIAVKHGFFRRHPTIAKVGLAVGYLFAAVAGAGAYAITGLLSSAVLLLEGVIMIVAFPALKKRAQRGWNLLFWSLVLSIVSSVLSLSVFGVIQSVIGALIGYYFLYQMKSYYK